MTKILKLISTIIVIIAVTACTPVVRNPVSSTVAVNAPISSPARDYRIQPGDQLDIKFFYNAELNEQVLVRPDGRISLQLAPEILAAGVTPAELTEQLRTKYSTVIEKPEIVVIVRSFSAQRVYVDGEVVRPGIVPLTDALTLTQAISQAGGFKDSARKGEIVIVRRSADGKASYTIVDVEKVMDGSDMPQDIALLSYDLVYVPKSKISNVNVWVDQYLRRNIPIPIGAGYNLN